MEGSTVYFTDFRCPVGTSLTDKLRRLCLAAGIKTIDMDGRFVAIKMHFGELGNLAFLRPNYAKVVADLCREQGGLPFLTDCNTLYPGSRKNALEHLACAQENGFWPMTTGCQILIGDGLRGTDEVEVPVPNGEYCKTAKIGRAIMDADVFISLTHFKGHESTGFGGAIKNIGISLVQDISPNCDCHGENDAPILPDIGMFASFDPVALDQACVDACLAAAPLPNSQLGQNLAKPGWNCHHDHFKDSNPNIEWKATLEQAEKIGMGTRRYTLKKV